MNTESYLRVEGVTKSFGAFQALRNISLQIDKGEFICFLGPSGCGKTTLLRAIAGLDVQTSGRIFQNGRDISLLPASKRDFGIVFQSYALFPNLSVGDNVGYGLKYQGQPKRDVEKRVKDLLDLVGIVEQQLKFPAQLSGGQQQRVALARALAMSPGLLLLDEPLSALDARVRVHLRNEIRGLQRRLGVTTILVTHDQEEALTMADRIVVMNQGTVEQFATPMEVYRQPSSLFVAQFVGETNVMPGVIESIGKVRMGGRLLSFGANPAAPSPGVRVAACFRPEDLALRQARSDAENMFEARIESIEFLGSFFRARLRLDDSPEYLLTADFSANSVQDLNLEPGRVIEAALPPDRLRIYPLSIEEELAG